MIKVTEKGIEQDEPRELSQEDLDFIGEMFDDFADYQKHPLDRPDRDWDD